MSSIRHGQYSTARDELSLTMTDGRVYVLTPDDADLIIKIIDAAEQERGHLQ